jgi:hypothetical protein
MKNNKLIEAKREKFTKIQRLKEQKLKEKKSNEKIQRIKDQSDKFA